MGTLRDTNKKKQNKVEAVGMGLFKCGIQEKAGQLAIRSAKPHGPLKIPLLVIQEARSQVAARREAQPVAFVTEMMRDGTDEAYLTGGVFERKAFCRAVLGCPGHRRQSTQSTHPILNHGARYVLQLEVQVVRSERHILNEPDMIGIFKRKSGKVNQFIVVQAFDHHHVDLDGMESHFPRPLDPFQDQLETIDARDLFKSVPPKGVQTDVEPFDAACPQHVQLFLEKNPVRGQRDIP
jgi:hypothetical protein